MTEWEMAISKAAASVERRASEIWAKMCTARTEEDPHAQKCEMTPQEFLRHLRGAAHGALSEAAEEIRRLKKEE